MSFKKAIEIIMAEPPELHYPTYYADLLRAKGSEIPNSSDLISRQAAILQLSHNKCGNDENDIAVQHDIETIRKLPSTEPKIVRCKDCAYYNWDCIDAPYGMTEMIR